MAGEMCSSDVTREEFPLHFAIADAFGGSVHPFDVYQGPYIMIGAEDMTSGNEPYAVPVSTRVTGGHRLWIQSEDGALLQVYNESNDKLSTPFFLMYEDDAADASAAVDAAAQVTGLTPKA